MKAVEIKDLSFSYNGEKNKSFALNSINLEINEGEKVVFLGANGSGKTTLLYHLNGLHLPQAGEVIILGKKIKKEATKNVRKLVGMVFENPDNQIISATVYDDVAFGLRNSNWDEEYIKGQVHYALGKVGALELTNRSPYNLSWGQKKRVALAGIVAMNPKILVLDEPFSGLDPHVSKSFLGLLDKINDEGKTIIMASHDVDMAYSWADKVVILVKGKISSQGTPDILEDQEFMDTSCLDTPLLAKIFSSTSYNPKNAREARGIIEKKIRGC